MVRTERSSQFLILGSGVVGLSLAWELSRRGQTVKLLEPRPTESPPSSWAGAGILPPAATRGAVDPYEQLRSLSHRLHAEWAEKLRTDTGIDTGFRRSGGIYLASSIAEAATLTANEYWWEQHGIDFHRLRCEELVRLEPQLKTFADTRLRGAWLLPDECQVRSPRHLKALRAACLDLGVEFEQASIERLEIGPKGNAILVSDNQVAYSADRICVCSGAWTRLLLDGLGVPSGIMPVRGQIILYQRDRPLLNHIINEGNRYLVPRDDGLVLAGSVEEEVGFVIETTKEATEYLAQWSQTIDPDLRPAMIRNSWAGLRPGSFDGLPYLGAVPGPNNLWVAAGHFRSGMHLSCATAVVMANVMLDVPNEIDLKPFRIPRG